MRVAKQLKAIGYVAGHMADAEGGDMTDSGFLVTSSQAGLCIH